MNEYALEWQGVVYSVRQGFWLKPVRIIDGLNLFVPKGSVTGLVGPNGAGKTTTIKLAAGLIRADQGGVLIHGVPSHTPKARTAVGLLTENQYVYPHLRLDEWLRMLGQLSGMTGNRVTERTRHVLEMVDLGGRSNALLHTLSKGQLQRAGLAQAFLHDPGILLLDEPMSGLDPFWRYRIQRILSEYAGQGGTILFSSHIISDVLELSDQIAVMASGRIKWKGSVRELEHLSRGVRAVVFTRTPERLERELVCETFARQQDGSYHITLASDQKNRLYGLASSGAIDVVSLNPLYSKIEEILHDHGFTAD